MRYLIVGFILFSMVKVGWSQTLTLDEFIRQVKEEHPRSRQIRLKEEMASAKFLKAKGGFDPSLSFDSNQKNYDQKSYYQLVNGELKVPTNFGVAFKTGYEWSRGLYVNPENNTPGGGLMYGGISVPLGRDLWIDERRTIRRKANIGLELADAEIKGEMNEWLFQAVLQYLEWQQLYMSSEVFSAAMKNVEERKEAIQRQIISGDRPAIDSTEIEIQRQMMELSVRQINLDRQKAQNKLERFYWQGSQQLIIKEDTRPEVNFINSEVNQETLANLDEFQESHPELIQYRYMLKQLEIDKKFARDRLKPDLRFSYNPILEPVGENIFTNLSWDNQKWGLAFYMPLFLRKERGALQLAEIEIKSTELEQNDKTSYLYAQYKNSVLEYMNIKEQYQLYRDIVNNYETMYNSERKLFEIGESSLFVVNSREQSLVQAKLKEIELGIKLKKAYFSMRYGAGQLPELF